MPAPLDPTSPKGRAVARRLTDVLARISLEIRARMAQERDARDTEQAA